MAESQPSSHRPRARWPLILGGLVGGVLLLAAGLALGRYLFYQPIVSVAVQLPASLPALAQPGPDPALDDQIEKQKAANKQLEEQIAQLKQRLKADVCTAKDPQGKDPLGKDPLGKDQPGKDQPGKDPLGKNPPAPSNEAASGPPPQIAAPAPGSGRSIRVFDPLAPGERRTVTPDWAGIETQPLGSKGNPVRSYQPAGEQAYLQRLRCPDGSTPVFQRQGSVGTGPYTTILDAYEVRCGGKSVVLYLDMYHPGYIERRAVPGFTIRPVAG